MSPPSPSASLLLLAPAAIVLACGATLFSPPASAQTLSYVESSGGLDTPELDGGDTEFEMVDVNGDGHVDLISVGDHGNPLINTDQEGIMVWFGNGLGTWTHTQSGHLGYGGVAVGDVNGDGLADVAYGIHHDYSSTDFGDQLLEVALGDGSGLSWTPWDDGLATHGQSWGLFATDLGDVDEDGDLDVGSTGFGSADGFHVYLNDGDGTWRRSFGYLEGNSDHVFVFGDVNNDGHLDVVTAKQEGTVWLGDGEGFFTGAEDNLPPLDPYDWRRGPSLGDVDGDGRDDLAYCDDDGNARVWLRREASWLDRSSGVPQTGDCQHTQLHDMDGDGLVDLASFGFRMVHVFGGDGAGSIWTTLAGFTVPDSPGSSRAFRVGGDVDHNGCPDMVLVSTKQKDLFNTVNELHLYREATTPSATTARVVRPGPHRRLLAGAVTFIEWASEVPVGQPSTVDLALSVSGPSGPWLPVATGLPNGGRYQWIVPARPATDARIRVTVDAGGGPVQAVSAAPFVIARRDDPLALTVSLSGTVAWQDALGRDRYNLYRSDWQHVLDGGGYTQDPAEEPQAARFCDLEAGSRSDTFVPAPGTLVVYLATGYRRMEDGQTPGVPVAMAEGTLGQGSSAATRENGHPCPPP